MKSIETQGKTVDQAIELGLYKLGTTRDQVKISILEELKNVSGIGESTYAKLADEICVN